MINDGVVVQNRVLPLRVFCSDCFPEKSMLNGPQQFSDCPKLVENRLVRGLMKLKNLCGTHPWGTTLAIGLLT